MGTNLNSKGKTRDERRKSAAETSKDDFPEQKSKRGQQERADTREEGSPALDFPETHRTLGKSL